MPLRMVTPDLIVSWEGCYMGPDPHMNVTGQEVSRDKQGESKPETLVERNKTTGSLSVKQIDLARNDSGVEDVTCTWRMEIVERWRRTPQGQV